MTLRKRLGVRVRAFGPVSLVSIVGSNCLRVILRKVLVLAARNSGDADRGEPTSSERPWTQANLLIRPGCVQLCINVQLWTRPAAVDRHVCLPDVGSLLLLGVGRGPQPQLVRLLSSTRGLARHLLAHWLGLHNLAMRVVACAHSAVSIIGGDQLRFQWHGGVAAHRLATVLQELLLVVSATWQARIELGGLPAVDDGLTEFMPVRVGLVVGGTLSERHAES